MSVLGCWAGGRLSVGSVDPCQLVNAVFRTTRVSQDGVVYTASKQPAVEQNLTLGL